MNIDSGREKAMDAESSHEEYEEEKTVFEFDGGNCWISIWIDRYWNDLEYPEEGEPDDLPKYYGEEIARNALHCGRNIAAKEGFGGACMFMSEFILAGEVVGLRERFEALRDGRIDGFGAYPEHYIGGEGEPFMQFSATREGEGVRVQLTLRPECDEENLGIQLGLKELDDLCTYFKHINEWFPPVGPGEKQVLRWGKSGESNEREPSDG